MSTILVFARAPVPGAVKTRLIPALGAAGAARLHHELVRHTLRQAAAAGCDRLELWITGDGGEAEPEDLAASVGACLRWQGEGGLGTRMASALSDAIARDGPALIIGSDCPWLDAATLADARIGLESRDAVLGPALDGGYVLLGLHRVEPSLFAQIPWGTDRVLALTRERLAALAWDWFELEPRSDIDRPEDLGPLRRLGSPWVELTGQAGMA